MKFIGLVYIYSMGLFTHLFANDIWHKYQITGFTQGTTYHIAYYAKHNKIEKHQIDSIFKKIDSSLSIYQENSLINKFNKSDEGIKVDDHFIKVVKHAQQIYARTDGLFDITLLPLMEAWGFTTKGIVPQTPTSENLLSLEECLGSDKLQVKSKKVLKNKPCVRIDVNGIAQGYSVDVVANFLKKHGIKNFIVEIGGEIRVSGQKQPSGELLAVGIQSPAKTDYLPNSIKKIVYLKNGAITTSGNYQKYYESNGNYISHLMNPKTRLPVDNELISVTVYAKNAITADGFDNALMAMGLNSALKFVEANKQLQAYFIYKEKGMVKDTASKGFYPLLSAPIK